MSSSAVSSGGYTPMARTLKVIWRGIPRRFLNTMRDNVHRHPLLRRATAVEFINMIYRSPDNGGDRMLIRVYDDETWLTSAHVYGDGEIIYSKDKYNRRQSCPGGGSGKVRRANRRNQE